MAITFDYLAKILNQQDGHCAVCPTPISVDSAEAVTMANGQVVALCSYCKAEQLIKEESNLSQQQRGLEWARGILKGII